MSIDQAEIKRRFTHHVPPDRQVRETHDAVRLAYLNFATTLMGLPEGREKSLAFTALEESSFWAHAAVAREAAGGQVMQNKPAPRDRTETPERVTERIQSELEGKAEAEEAPVNPDADDGTPEPDPEPAG
jgi:hypothetical protein